MRILLDLEELKVPYLLTGHGTTRSFLEKNRSVVVKFMRASMLAIKRIKTDRPFAEKVLAKYVRTYDQEAVKTALDHQIKILPDIPTPSRMASRRSSKISRGALPRRRTSPQAR